MRDNTRHVILGTASYRPLDFAGQLNVSLANGWGIMRAIIDLCMKQPEGKYVLIKDPNKVCSGSVLSPRTRKLSHLGLSGRSRCGPTAQLKPRNAFTYASVLTAGHPSVFRSRKCFHGRRGRRRGGRCLRAGIGRLVFLVT